jgi:hypothetical protein
MKQQQQVLRPHLIPLIEWNRYHVWPPQGTLRSLMFNRKCNGFAPAFVKCGRRVLIDETRFFECLTAKRERECAGYE